MEPHSEVIHKLECQMCGHEWWPRGKKEPRRCVNPECKSMRWSVARYPHAGPPQPPTPNLRGRKVSVSDKSRRSSILLNRVPQLQLPLSIAASILIVLALAFAPSRLYAYNPRLAVGVQGASPQENLMPAKAALQRVVVRKPVPYMPHAHVPTYLLCYVVETLECGHDVTTYPQSDPLIAKYRRCQKCDANRVVPIDVSKKPPVSVQFSNVPSTGRKRA